jgi:prepilin-type N-terminal cleavage/methylation domain-containing protein
MLKINKKLSKQGFSLIELMVAITILAMAIFGIFQAYSVGFMGMVDARNVTVATNYAREKMEEIKNKSFVNIAPEYPPEYILGQTKFEREVSVDPIQDDGIEVGKEITTTVSWNDRNGNPKEVKLGTLIYDY